MDPLSITGTIISITGACLAITKTLNGLLDRYKHAQLTISSICSECTVISASLSRIQSLVLHNTDPLAVERRYRPELETVFDTALTGCKIVLSVLDNEVQAISHSDAGAALGLQTKTKLVWKEDTMQKLLTQLRGQQTALNLLIQAIQMESLGDIGDLMRQNNAALQNLTQKTLSLRESYPRVRPPSTLVETSPYNRGSFQSGGARASTVTEFDFDEIVMSSNVYRRALAGATQTRSPTGDHEPGTISSDSQTSTSNQNSDEPVPEDRNEGKVFLEEAITKANGEHNSAIARLMKMVEEVFVESVKDKPAQERLSGRERLQRDHYLRTISALDEDSDAEIQAVSAWFSVLSQTERLVSAYCLSEQFSPYIVRLISYKLSKSLC